MESNNLKSAGLSLMVGSLLMIATMVLHPVGGNFHHLLRIATIGKISHSLGLLSVPFVAYGYWGVMKQLERALFLSRIAFSIMLFGLVAVMIAATLNGLVLTQFVESYKTANNEVIDSLRPIFRYNMAFNDANDYIYMTAVGLSTMLWSIAIFRTRQLPLWIGYFGIVLVAVVLASLATGFVFTDVYGFSMFIFGAVAWTILVGWNLFRK